MPDPITAEIATTIATAVAGQAAQTLTSQALHALSDLAKRIKEKFRDHPAELAVLTSNQNAPASPEMISALAHALWHAARDDPEFGTEIAALWNKSQAQANLTGNASANIFHGNANTLVQVHEIHGDINIR